MFLAADAAPLPAALGVLAETERRVGPLVVPSDGLCSTEVEAHQIGIELQLDPEAAAWRDALHFETLVDGRTWRASRSVIGVTPPGESWQGRAVDRVYRVCDRGADQTVSEGLAEGLHEVVMRATLPGSGTVVSSSSLTVEIDCEPAGGTGGGCDAGASGSSGWLLLGALAALGCRRRRRAR
jgi:hypothetical protein